MMERHRPYQHSSSATQYKQYNERLESIRGEINPYNRSATGPLGQDNHVAMTTSYHAIANYPSSSATTQSMQQHSTSMQSLEQMERQRMLADIVSRGYDHVSAFRCNKIAILYVKLPHEALLHALISKCSNVCRVGGILYVKLPHEALLHAVIAKCSNVCRVGGIMLNDEYICKCIFPGQSNARTTTDRILVNRGRDRNSTHTGKSRGVKARANDQLQSCQHPD